LRGVDEFLSPPLLFQPYVAPLCYLIGAWLRGEGAWDVVWVFLGSSASCTWCARAMRRAMIASTCLRDGDAFARISWRRGDGWNIETRQEAMFPQSCPHSLPPTGGSPWKYPFLSVESAVLATLNSVAPRYAFPSQPWRAEKLMSTQKFEGKTQYSG
jgi:hypothetical protein